MERTLREEIAALGDEKRRPFLIFIIGFNSIFSGLQSLHLSTEQWLRLVAGVAIAGTFSYLMTLLLIKKFAPEKAKERLSLLFVIFTVLVSQQLATFDLSGTQLLKFGILTAVVALILYFTAMALIKWARRSSQASTS